ncbi:MAG: aspartate kinase [Phycisphaeraceae bacterium]|nr:aspartate kinase [Phycisphaeraceae bacterium]
MKVFKFGGASVKSADAVKNIITILGRFPDDNLVIVISAMGKSTNALETYNEACFHKDPMAAGHLEQLQAYHLEIMDALFESRDHEAYQDVQTVFDTLAGCMQSAPWLSYDAQYDAVVSCGELISTKIVSHYLNDQQLNNTWFDARELVQTDGTHREGKVDWKLTSFLINKSLIPYLTSPDGAQRIAITQGFITGTMDNKTVTLGREGSDYSGAIFAYCCDAEAMLIWKDVPGVLNADPKYFDDTKRLPIISYKEAIELAYYGASVIHPKTIKPLQNKQIPLWVKSFVSPDDPGTQIQETLDHDHLIPSYIFKIDQVLLSIAPRDFSFIDEHNLSCIFGLFAKHLIKLHVMQNSAISFSVCIDNKHRELPTLLKELQETFEVKYNEGLELITVRHYTEETIEHLIEQKEVLLLQKGRATARLVVKPLVEVEWMKER